jgi:hypothetical protein
MSKRSMQFHVSWNTIQNDQAMETTCVSRTDEWEENVAYTHNGIQLHILKKAGNPGIWDSRNRTGDPHRAKQLPHEHIICII